jgi:hypothetical protein
MDLLASILIKPMKNNNCLWIHLLLPFEDGIMGNIEL